MTRAVFALTLLLLASHQDRGGFVASTSNLEGRGVRSGCQHLPQGLDPCRSSVASANARGGRPVPQPNPILTPARPVLPILAFPEPGLDDSAAYQGYQTRLYRDSKENTVQIYLQPQSARAVLLWADAVNESVGFTVRDAGGRPARLRWGAEAAAAEVSGSGSLRTIEYRLTAGVSHIEVGWFLLGSMRVERDFVYAKRHLEPFSAPPFRVAEESLLVADVARLPAAERRRHLVLLNARTIAELRSRLLPSLAQSGTTASTIRVERPSLDGRNRLVLELTVDPHKVKTRQTGNSVSFQTRPGSSVQLRVKITTDAAPLTPLKRQEIFTPAFLEFLERASGDSSAVTYSRRLERQVRGVELLSTREKLMAGLPNFATYFGRDMMMTALMMRPIWSPEMAEHVIGSVLRKLGPRGDVSHEEALGGQAIRENAVVYDSLITRYLGVIRAGRRPKADSLLGQAREVLRALQATRENYHMMDDEFQLPVLEAGYLGDSAVAPDRRRGFLLEKPEGGASRLTLMLREMALVATETRPYAQAPRATNLVGFSRRDATHWRSASWRDSDAGYANGRFAMDINVIWAPAALAAIATILETLPALGLNPPTIDSMAPEIRRTALGQYMRDPASLRRAIEAWKGARRHFEITLTPEEIRQRTRSKLAWLPELERSYWDKVLSARGEVKDSLTFLVLALDAEGHPIPVVNTDPSTELFLIGPATPDLVLRDVAPFLRPYPVGLFVDGLGPLVANDAYTAPEIWERFQADPYHGPRVVWGREVNLLLLGVANQLAGAFGGAGQLKNPALEPYVRSLDKALRSTLDAVNASGLQHNELWSYEIKEGRLVPTRYGTTSDVQLWNTTNLVVQYVLSKLPRLSP
jgi:type II secretory pathway component PulM